jgi:hypothetical protein
VRDWDHYVRTHLSLPALAREREARILRELSSQLEDFYREAIAGGMTDAEADAYARAQVTDWPAGSSVAGRTGWTITPGRHEAGGSRWLISGWTFATRAVGSSRSPCSLPWWS